VGRLLAGVVLMGALAAGAAASAVGSGGSQTRLERALMSVADGPSSRAGFTWADEAALRAAGVVPPNAAAYFGLKNPLGPWLNAAGSAGGELMIRFDAWKEAGLDPLAADQLITISAQADATRLDGGGFDPARLRSFLTGAGAKPLEADGRSLLAVGPEGKRWTTGPLAAFDRVLDRVAINGSQLAAGSTLQDVEELLGGGKSMLAVADDSLAAACLGKVAFAEIYRASSIVKAIPGATLVAIGIGPPARSSAIGNDELCTVYPSRATAEARLAIVRKRMSLTAKDVSGAPYSRTFSHSSASLVSGGGLTAVRLVLQPRTAGGINWALSAIPSFAYVHASGAPG
jgi:hypothetical protein